MNFKQFLPDTVLSSYLGVRDLIDYVHPNDDFDDSRFNHINRQLFADYVSSVILHFKRALQEGIRFDEMMYVETPFVTSQRHFKDNTIGLITISLQQTNSHYEELDGIRIRIGFCRMFSLDGNQIIAERDVSYSTWNHSYTPKNMLFLGESNPRFIDTQLFQQFAHFDASMVYLKNGSSEMRLALKRLYDCCKERLQVIPIHHKVKASFPPAFHQPIF